MDGFTATLLVCLIGTPVELCDKTTAVDILSHHVANELQCTVGWQELAAHLGQPQDIGTQTYVRTLCQRAGQNVAQLRTARKHD